MWEDPIVAEVRRVREQLCAQFNFDVKAIFADLRQRQGALGERLVNLSAQKTNKAAQPLGAAGGIVSNIGAESAEYRGR